MILDAIKTDTTFRVEARNLSQERIPNSGVGFLRKTNHYAIFINEKIYEMLKQLQINNNSLINDINENAKMLETGLANIVSEIKLKEKKDD